LTVIHHPIELLAIIEHQKYELQLKCNSFGRMEDEHNLLKGQLVELEEELEEKASTIEALQKGKAQYRDWWLNEIRFTRFLLRKDPDAHHDVFGHSTIQSR
jgi:hypothetical protein